MDVHIQLDPNPMKSIAKIQLDIGQYHIQSQEYLLETMHLVSG